MPVNNVNEPIHVLGISDVNTRPEEIYSTIQGYEKEPLVSLEDAIEPLIPHIRDVERMVQMVKDFCDAPEHKLTRDESTAILLYSMEWEPPNQSFCYILNTTLQKNDRDILKPWFLYLRLIIAALVKLPSEPNRFTVYRGLKMDLSAQLRKGNKIVWWAFSSCTVSLDVLNNERFLGKNGVRTLFVIDCYSGKKIRNHTFYPEEEEVLFFPACQFEVMGCINEGNDLLVVQLKEIEPKYTIINIVQPSTKSSQNVLLCVPSPTPQYISPVPIEQSITPTFASSTMISMPSEEKSLPPLRLQCFLAKSARSVLPPIQSSNNPARQSIVLPTNEAPQLVALPLKPAQQPITQPAERTQVAVRPKRQPTAKSSYNNNKPLEQKEALHIDRDCTKLDLQNSLIGEEGAKDIAEQLKHNRTLTTLSLWYNKINDRGAQYLADSLKSNETLTALHLSYNEIGSQGAAYIANALKCNKTLTTLYLSYNHIGDPGAQHLANALRENTSLTTLNLYSNQIGSQGTEDLAKALQDNKTLTTLNLADNQIDDAGVQHIAHALRYNTTLKTLNLNNNLIGNVGAQSLANTLKNFKTLTNLYICNKGLSNETKKLFEELKKRDAGLKIFF